MRLTAPIAGFYSALLVLVAAGLACRLDPERRPVAGDPAVGADPHGVSDADAPDDLVPADGAHGADPAVGDPACPVLPPFDYHCDPGDLQTCPEGLCLFSQCIALILDRDRWQECANSNCDRCETANSCPVDCAAPLEEKYGVAPGSSTNLIDGTACVAARRLWIEPAQRIVGLVHSSIRGQAA